MDFQLLRTFIIAAEQQNFRRTAEILFISQPSVTVHIKQLERELELVLFEREGRQLKLTEAGRRFYQHAKQLLKKYEESIAELQALNQGYSRELKIAISPLIADTILPYVLKSFLDKHPDVEINVKIVESTMVEEEVANEEVDIGLSGLSARNTDLFCNELYEDPVVLVVPHDGHDSETALPLDEEEILTSNYILTHNHPAYWNNLLKSIKHLYPRVKTMKVSQIHITKRFISEGLGVSFLPTSTIRRELLEGRLLEVNCHSLKLPIAKTYAIYKYDHSLEKEFLNYLGEFRI